MFVLNTQNLYEFFFYLFKNFVSFFHFEIHKFYIKIFFNDFRMIFIKISWYWTFLMNFFLKNISTLK